MTGIHYRYIGLETFLPYRSLMMRQLKCLHCLAVCIYMMLSRKDFGEDGQTQPLAMRLEVKEDKQGCILINDSYTGPLRWV